METNLPDISYNKKRTYKSKRYTILIPDDAILQTNVNGAGGANRDFTAFLSHDKNDEWNEAPVSFSSAGAAHTSDGTALTAEQAYQHCQSMVPVFAATTGDKATVYRYDHGKIHGAICHQKISDDCSNFHIWAGEDGHMYQFRVIFNVEVPDKQMLDLVKGWLDTMEMTFTSTVTNSTQSDSSERNRKICMLIFNYFEAHTFQPRSIAEMKKDDDSFSEYSKTEISQVIKELQNKRYLEEYVKDRISYYYTVESIDSLYQKAAEAEKEMNKAEDNLSQCQLKYDSIPEIESLLVERKNRNLSQIETAKEAESAAKKAYDDSVERTEQTVRERKESGLFEFNKKKQLKSKIAELKSEALAHQASITAAREEQEQIRVRIQEDEQRTAAEIEKIRNDFFEAQKIFSEAKDKFEPLDLERKSIRNKYGIKASQPKKDVETQESKKQSTGKNGTKKVIKEKKPKYERSNMFANIECKFKYADEETILDSIKRSGSVIIRSGLDEQTKIGILIMCANYGFGDKVTLSDKQKKAVDVFLGTMVNGDINGLYNDMSRKITDNHTSVITALGQLPPDTALAVLHYILAHVYIDGKLDDERAEFLDKTFGQALLMNFLQSGEEEVPGPFVQLSGLDADIGQYFDENDQLMTFDDVCKQFPDADRDAVKKSLDYLVEEEVLYIADTAVGQMYARLT